MCPQHTTVKLINLPSAPLIISLITKMSDAYSHSIDIIDYVNGIGNSSREP